MTLIVRLLVWHVKSEKSKVLKKKLNEELMPVSSHLNTWLDWCMSGYEKKQIDPMLIEEL